MNSKKRLKNFFLPDPSLKFILRVIVIALSAYLIFTFIFIPLRVKGHSMAPTYKDGQLNFCWRLRYLFSEPGRHDVVVVRYAGKGVMLLKRVVALGGEEIEIKDGKLIVDGRWIKEPYIGYSYDWTLPPRRVEEGNIYLVGDNRRVPMACHDFGQTSMRRVMGAPLW